MKKFLAGLISLVLVVGIGVGAYFLFFKKAPSEETSVMTMSVNPEVQFILDQNNNVMNVTAVNEDGVNLTTQVNFVGMKAEDCAKLFVEISSQMGKVSFDATATAGEDKSVKIYISCDDSIKNSDTIKNLQQNVQNSVNTYFKENGIINGAKVVLEDMSAALAKFGSQIEEFTGTTFEEAMAYAKEISNEFEDISYSVRQNVQTVVNSLKDTFETANKLLISTINETQTQIADLQKRLNDSELLPEAVKKEINNQIAELQKTLNTKQAEYKTKLEELQKQIDEKIKEFQQQCKEALETVKSEINKQIEAGKELINSHKEEFEAKTEAQKNAIIAAIEAYQNSLANANA